MSQASLNPSAVPLESTSFDPGLRIRLSVMMFLQYAVWGAWYSVLNVYLAKLGFSGSEIGWAYATVSIASIFSPLVFGQIADRWVAAQYLLVVLHLAGAVMLFLMTRFETFGPFFACALVYALLYMPTLSLTNALALHHIRDAGRHFPGVRVFGTIGWIVIGLFVGWYLNQSSSAPVLAAAVLSIITGVYCLTLPHTPPKGKAGETLPFIRALGLLKERVFALFIFVSFILAVVLAGYFLLTGRFLDAIGVKKIAAVMTVGQMSEMILLPLLPVFLRFWGMKWTLMLGMAAWGVRYWLFSIGHPMAVIYIAIALHGVCYDFFFVAAYIYVDSKAGQEIRASAQALFNLVVMGLGMFLGTLFFGVLSDRYSEKVGEVTKVDWHTVWAFPILGAIVVLVIFFIGFREKKASAEGAQAAPAA